MTMKAFELSQVPAQVEAPPASLGIRRAASRFFAQVRSAFARYVAHNEHVWDRVAEEQSRDPNRF
jgi:hypothetical protein